MKLLLEPISYQCFSVFIVSLHNLFVSKFSIASRTKSSNESALFVFGLDQFCSTLRRRCLVRVGDERASLRKRPNGNN